MRQRKCGPEESAVKQTIDAIHGRGGISIFAGGFGFVGGFSECSLDGLILGCDQVLGPGGLASGTGLLDAVNEFDLPNALGNQGCFLLPFFPIPATPSDGHAGRSRFSVILS